MNITAIPCPITKCLVFCEMSTRLCEWKGTELITLCLSLYESQSCKSQWQMFGAYSSVCDE